MSFFTQISQLVADPAPGYVFELSEAGVAFAQPGQGRNTKEAGFLAFPPATLAVSPVEDNILKPEAATAVLRNAAPQDGSKKRRPAALILPDYCARVNVLDFDSFPAAPEEQLALIRFRLKKTLPFDIDSAAVSYYAQPPQAAAAGAKEKIEVVAVIVALSVIARYEALFRSLNFHAGEVTTSALAALNLFSAPPGDSISVIAKLAGSVLTVMVMQGATLKLFRCVALDKVTEEEALAVLQPTFAYVEDELAAPVSQLILCGFREGALPGLGGERGQLLSQLGTPGAYNAGLLGYLEGTRN
jgi:type IV pilus assembly protein PilM